MTPVVKFGVYVENKAVEAVYVVSAIVWDY